MLESLLKPEVKKRPEESSMRSLGDTEAVMSLPKSPGIVHNLHFVDSNQWVHLSHGAEKYENVFLIKHRYKNERVWKVVGGVWSRGIWVPVLMSFEYYKSTKYELQTPSGSVWTHYPLPRFTVDQRYIIKNILISWLVSEVLILRKSFKQILLNEAGLSYK